MADVKKPIAKAAAKKPESAPVGKTVPAAKAEPDVSKTESVKAEEVKAAPAAAKKAPAKKATPAKKAAKPAAKKTAAKTATAKTATEKTTVVEKMNIQFSGKSYSMEDLMSIAKDVWRYDLKQKPADLKNIELYVKPEESVAYYVINGEVTGSFYI